ncbi:hypothetical protein ACWGI0_35370 [Streptomyces sp. NPDC054802]
MYDALGHGRIEVSRLRMALTGLEQPALHSAATPEYISTTTA